MKGALTVAAGAHAPAAAASEGTKPPEYAPHAATVAINTRGNQPLAWRMDRDTPVFQLVSKHVSWEVYPGEDVDACACDRQAAGLDNPGGWVFHCHILGHVQHRGVEPGEIIPVLKVAE